MVTIFRFPKTLLLFACTGILGCSASLVGARWTVREVPINAIAVGDTPDTVIQKLGKPVNTATAPAEPGHVRMEWHYPEVAESQESVSSRVEPLARNPVSIERQARQTASAEYVVTFEDGKVISWVKRKP